MPGLVATTLETVPPPGRPSLPRGGRGATRTCGFIGSGCQANRACGEPTICASPPHSTSCWHFRRQRSPSCGPDRRTPWVGTERRRTAAVAVGTGGRSRAAEGFGAGPSERSPPRESTSRRDVNGRASATHATSGARPAVAPVRVNVDVGASEGPLHFGEPIQAHGVALTGPGYTAPAARSASTSGAA